MSCRSAACALIAALTLASAARADDAWLILQPAHAGPLLREIDAEWRAQHADAHALPIALEMPTGDGFITSAVTHRPASGLQRRVRYNLESVFAGNSVPLLSIGAHWLFAPADRRAAFHHLRRVADGADGVEVDHRGYPYDAHPMSMP